MTKQQLGYLITIVLILLTGLVSVSAAKQLPDFIDTGFDTTQP